MSATVTPGLDRAPKLSNTGKQNSAAYVSAMWCARYVGKSRAFCQRTAFLLYSRKVSLRNRVMLMA